MPVYLDQNATSPMHPEVMEASLPFLRLPPANPSRLPGYGRIARLGRAAGVAGLEMEQRRQYLAGLRDAFETRLASIPGSVVFGQQAPRLPDTTYFALPYYHGETLLMELDRAGFALSCGSACDSAATEPSHLLQAVGVDDSLALNAIRVSFGMSNSLQDVEALFAKLQELVNKLPAVFRQAAV
jgi:cysteine desulfurase